MTNHWIDIKNSDVIMILGSNAAENHPISFKWVTEAMKNGGKLIVVDPRFTRSASKASIDGGIQLYSKMRSGTDIAFMLGMMKWAIDNNRINWQYVRDCTNASFLICSGFQTCSVNNFVFDNPETTCDYSHSQTGIFSGLVEDTRRHKKYKYNKSCGGCNPGHWVYQYHPNPPAGTKQPLVDCGPGYWDTIPPSGTPHANSVWAKFIEQISRYTISNVCKITGADPTVLAKIYDVYTSTCLDDKSACIMYAMGSTQHTYGSQNVRTYAMMQLLLGNVGVAGGGINALRGESNVQGSTDMCLLYHILPGYLSVTNNSVGHKDRASYKAGYTSAHTPQDPTPGGGSGNPVSLAWWKNAHRYLDSLLQAWWPTQHTGHANLDTAYHYLPKADSNMWYTHE